MKLQSFDTDYPNIMVYGLVILIISLLTIIITMPFKC